MLSYLNVLLFYLRLLPDLLSLYSILFGSYNDNQAKRSCIHIETAAAARWFHFDFVFFIQAQCPVWSLQEIILANIFFQDFSMYLTMRSKTKKKHTHKKEGLNRLVVMAPSICQTTQSHFYPALPRQRQKNICDWKTTIILSLVHTATHGNTFLPLITDRIFTNCCR